MLPHVKWGAFFCYLCYKGQDYGKGHKISFYLRDINSTTPTPINFVLSKGYFRKKVGIGESILPQWWDIETENAIEDSRQKKAEKALSKRVNRNLKHLRELLDELIEEYCGLDKLTPNHTEGEESITILIQKTNSKLKIPLHNQVVEIYKKYNGNLPKVIDKSKYNEQVRKCAMIAGINQKLESFTWVKGRPEIKVFQKYELISSHTGRRSFATNLYLACKSWSHTMALTGHTSEENFRRYLCINQEEMAEMLRKYINLDYEESGEDSNKTFEQFVKTLKADTITIHEQEGKIEQLQKDKQSLKQIASVAEMEKQMVESELEYTKEAWETGLTIDEYKDIQKKQDEIASIIDKQEVD